MTRRDKHPSADQLARLAVGELRPRKAAKIQAHVAQCEQCARVSQQLKAIAAVLASASYPPMPHNLTARIESAISSEAMQRVAAMPATQAGRRELPSGGPRAGAGGGWRLPGLPATATRLAAAASAVVIAAAGSYVMAKNAGTSVTRSSSSPLAAAIAPAQHISLGPDVTYGRPGSLHTIRAVDSHTNFVAADLRAEAISAVDTAEAREAFAAQPSGNIAVPLTGSTPGPAAELTAGLVADSLSGGRLAGCVRLIAPGRTVLLIDVARYQGKPAAVIVTASTVVSEAEAWVVGSSCSATTRDVLTETALGSL
jgi:negative regulator of sigma E activity